MILDKTTLPRIVDLSCVGYGIGRDELELMVRLGKEYSFIACLSLPYYIPWLIEELKDRKDIAVAGVAGFPSGGDLTSTKVLETKEQIAQGCTEIDMVVNIGELKSDRIDSVKDDIKAVVEAADGVPVKSILEVTLLTDDEIRRGAEAAVKAGAVFVKTGTGWMKNPTTVAHIELIRDAIGDSAFIKAAGGVRTLDDIVSMMDAGCSRFGIGVKSIISIIDELERTTP